MRRSTLPRSAGAVSRPAALRTAALTSDKRVKKGDYPARLDGRATARSRRVNLSCVRQARTARCARGAVLRDAAGEPAGRLPLLRSAQRRSRIGRETGTLRPGRLRAFPNDDDGLHADDRQAGDLLFGLAGLRVAMTYRWRRRKPTATHSRRYAGLVLQCCFTKPRRVSMSSSRTRRAASNASRAAMKASSSA